MPTFYVTGNTPLFGSVRLGGAKNASYKLMIAALLGNSESRILNFSHISDVNLVARLINDIGGRASMVGDRAYVIDPRALSQDTIDSSSGEASRASTLFIPALLHRFGRAIVPFPGGDKIGKRPLERHFDGLIALGATVRFKDHTILVETPNGLIGTTYRFEKNTHTGTETLIQAAAVAKGTTILENAAQETEIDDLIEFLNNMGAQIERQPDRRIKIRGVPTLHGAIHRIMPDQNQAVSFACAALATKGDIVIEDAREQDLQAFLQKVDEIGGRYEVGTYGIRFFYEKPLRATDVTTEVHPGFKTDWQPLWSTLMTQAVGTSTLHETVQQSRFQYVSALRTMGAKIDFFTPKVLDPEKVYNFNLHDLTGDESHAISIFGPTPLHAGEFTVTDLRHGATLMIAGMVADGETILHDPSSHIDRGYEQLDAQLGQMGAKIRRMSD